MPNKAAAPAPSCVPFLRLPDRRLQCNTLSPLTITRSRSSKQARIVRPSFTDVLYPGYIHFSFRSSPFFFHSNERNALDSALCNSSAVAARSLSISATVFVNSLFSEKKSSY
jgi:hypothetical protein